MLRHRNDFHWGADADAKRDFVGRSRRRRRRLRIATAGALGLALLLGGAGWQWNRWQDHADDLARWKLPHDLHHYHRQARR